MIEPSKEQQKEKEHKKEHKVLGGSHYERHENSVTGDEIQASEPEHEDEENTDSRERTEDSFKQDGDKAEIIFDLESYRPAMIRAAVILETEGGVRVFKTAQLQQQFAIRDIVEAFKKKAKDFDNGAKLIEYFEKNPIPSKGSRRHGLSKYYIEYKGKKYPLSFFTPSGRAKKS